MSAPLCSSGRRRAAAASLAAALVLVPARPHAQDAADVRRHLEAGDVARAVAVFDEGVRRGATPDPALLASLAEATLGETSRSTDPLVRAQSAGELLRRGREARARDLTAAAGADAPFAYRVIAVTELAAAGRPGAADRIEQLAASAANWSEALAVVEATRRLPDALATRLLTRLAGGEYPEVTMQAALRLGEIGAESAAPMLRRLAATNPPTATTLPALIALTRLGDDEAARQVVERLHLLQGADRLWAGAALAARGDARGIEALRGVLNGDHELLRLDAAAALARRHDRYGLEALAAALSSPNAWIQRRAYELAPALGRIDPVLWRGLADRDEWVRLRAAQSVLALLPPGAAATPPQ